MVICIAYEDYIYQYILTMKEKKIFIQDYSYKTQVVRIKELVPTHNPDGEGTYLVMVFQNFNELNSPLNCS